MFDIARHWYRPSCSMVSLLLLPFSIVYAVIIKLRQYLYAIGVFKIVSFDAPVIVVGNITVGGTGKTPLVIWLANYLQRLGYRPGIVSRGYGGKPHKLPKWVTNECDPLEVGDEACLLTRNTHCPVVVCTDRVKAVAMLLQDDSCDIVLADDGLQHHRLGAAIKIAVVDNERRFGNGLLLPAGPLREPISRLHEVDFVISHGSDLATAHSMKLIPVEWIQLATDRVCQLNEFSPAKAHAVAGIGHPDKFFNTLSKMGYKVIAHRFPDHYHFKATDLQFADDYPIIMTEKDAVKCKSFANERIWYLRVVAELHNHLIEQLTMRLNEITYENKVTNDAY